MGLGSVRAFDKYILSVFCIFIGVFVKVFGRRKFVKAKVKKILVVKLWALGDSVISLVLIRQLRKSFPKAQIDALVQSRNISVYQGNKDVNNILMLNFATIFKLFRKYDLCFDTEPYLNISALVSFFISSFRVGFAKQVRSILYNKSVEFKQSQHMVDNYLDMMRVLGLNAEVDRLVKIEVSSEDKKNVDALFKANGIKKSDFVIGISPGVAETVKSRMWPIERMAELSDKLIEKYKAKIVFIDAPSNKEFVDKIIRMVKHKKNVVDIAGKTKVRESFYAIGKCRIFISNDTGPMHVGAAQGVRTIGLFGPNLPWLWGPYGKGNIALYHKVECSPCIFNAKGKFLECIYKGTNDYQKCMKLITVDEVLKAVEKLRRAK